MCKGASRKITEFFQKQPLFRVSLQLLSRFYQAGTHADGSSNQSVENEESTSDNDYIHVKSAQ